MTDSGTETHSLTRWARRCWCAVTDSDTVTHSLTLWARRCWCAVTAAPTSDSSPLPLPTSRSLFPLLSSPPPDLRSLLRLDPDRYPLSQCSAAVSTTGHLLTAPAVESADISFCDSFPLVWPSQENSGDGWGEAEYMPHQVDEGRAAWRGLPDSGDRGVQYDYEPQLLYS